MIEEYNSNNLPVELNRKLDEVEGLVKEVPQEEYQRTMAKCKSIKSLREFISKRQRHTEVGIVVMLETAIRLFVKSRDGNMSKRFTTFGVTEHQQELIYIVELLMRFQYNQRLLMARLRLSKLPINLLFMLLSIIYQESINTNEDSTNVIRWLSIVYDSSFLQICVDPRLQSTLQVVSSLVSRQLETEAIQVQLLSMIQELTSAPEHYSNPKEYNQIDTIYIRF